MAKKEHVEDFFSKGILQLGSFQYFNSFDHKEIGDAAEGEFIVGRIGPASIAVSYLGGGFNHYAFC